MEKSWLAKPVLSSPEVSLLAEAIHISPLLAYLLAERGISTFDKARDFFRPSLDHLHDPFLMKDMDKAVERLTQAVHQGERILVYGDYDVDGTTAVTLVFSFLKKIGADCDYYIPNRYTEGYGFSFASVDFASQHNFSLIITLDCGIKDGEKVKMAQSLGIDVIICDHHNPGELPEAVAVLDPKRADCNYPFSGLSGCGVGYKLLQGFCIQHDIDMKELNCYLDLLTISIGADIVPLIDENRILAFHGLATLANTKRPGIAAMLEQAAFTKTELTITDVVFVLAPRINAAGRIFSGKQAVELLLAESLEEAKKLSPALEENNKTRKGLDKEITVEAIQLVSTDPFYVNSFSTVIASEGWSKGVVGIVASRMVETYYKPAIVLEKNGEKMSGSARSIEGIDLYEVLGKCTDLLDQFGGHTMAAGLSLKAENFSAFRERFDAIVSETLKQVRPVPFIIYDLEIQFDDLTPKFNRILKQFSPFGPGNMKPVFLVRNVCNARFTRPVGETGAHLKLHVAQKKNLDIAMDGIAFDLGHWSETLLRGNEVDLLFTLEENEWNGKTSIQLSVKDIRRAEKSLQNESECDELKAS